MRFGVKSLHHYSASLFLIHSQWSKHYLWIIIWFVLIHPTNQKQSMFNIKSCKHWSLVTKLSSSVTAIFLSVKSNQEQLYVLIAPKIRGKKRMTSYAHWRVTCFFCIYILRHVYYSRLRSEKKFWAIWARILKNTITDEQLCS